MPSKNLYEPEYRYVVINSSKTKEKIKKKHDELKKFINKYNRKNDKYFDPNHRETIDGYRYHHKSDIYF